MLRGCARSTRRGTRRGAGHWMFFRSVAERPQGVAQQLRALGVCVVRRYVHAQLGVIQSHGKGISYGRGITAIPLHMTIPGDTYSRS